MVRYRQIRSALCFMWVFDRFIAEFLQARLLTCWCVSCFACLAYRAGSSRVSERYSYYLAFCFLSRTVAALSPSPCVPLPHTCLCAGPPAHSISLRPPSKTPFPRHAHRHAAKYPFCPSTNPSNLKNRFGIGPPKSLSWNQIGISWKTHATQYDTVVFLDRESWPRKKFVE